MVTCLVDTLFPRIGQAVVDVLNKAGCEVHIPAGQTCCGQPAYNAGLWLEARQMAERTIEVLESVPGPVIIPSGSCTAMIRHGYPALFAQEQGKEDMVWANRAKALAERTFEFSEYLVDILQMVEFNAAFPGPITYHASCHLLRGLGVHRQPLALLKAVQDARFPERQVQVETLDLPNYDDCCGFGGVFSVEHARLSAAMVGRKLENIHKSGAKTVVCCDAGCLANIAGALVANHRQGESRNQIRVLHLAEVLASDIDAP
jgi:L-lactate dehydrogenase complex protein LldE